MIIEAHSLAAITELASNPPPEPRTGALSSATSLTLYIVRVPGSRDVFLTPLKPRDRVVNAQDVQSSLYFIHHDNPGDLLLDQHDGASSPQSEDAAPPPLPKRPVAVINRRPLPTPPASPCDEQGPAPALPPRDRWSHVPARKPVVPQRSPNRSSVTNLDLDGTHSINTRSSSPVAEPKSSKLTLIRRDPSSGEQWNVAKIRDPPIDEVSSTDHREDYSMSAKVKNAGAPLYLEVDTPGYSKHSQDPTFQRRLWLDGSKHADHSYSAHRSLPIVDRRSRGYAFNDVWGQRCEFATATTGRALKCRRTGSPGDLDAQPNSDVSELRFNLHSHHFTSRSETAAGSELHGYGSHNGHHRAHSDTGAVAGRGSLSLDGSVDYSLGRERAGGGFGGRQPKLGKLIVHAAGQEMLDLVVAANMALWWRAYERTGH